MKARGSLVFRAYPQWRHLWVTLLRWFSELAAGAGIPNRRTSHWSGVRPVGGCWWGSLSGRQPVQYLGSSGSGRRVPSLVLLVHGTRSAET